MKIVDGRDGEIITGDLRETFEARGGGRLWYWIQVLSCLLVRMSPHRRVIPDLRRDLHYTFRIIRRNPGYATTAMLCLALGIGVNTTVFSWLDEMYFRRLAVPDPDQVVSIDRSGGPACSWQEYRALATGLHSIPAVAAVIPKETFLDIDLVNDQIYAEVVSANYFGVMRVQPAAGRAFESSEDEPNSDPVVVISDRAWSHHFRRDPRAIGKSIRIEDQWYRIVGVAPPGFEGASAPLAVDAWVPLATYPHYRPQLIARPSSAGPSVVLVGRLARSRSFSEATAEIQVVDSRMRQAQSGSARFKNPMTVRPVVGYNWTEVRRGLRPVATLLGAVVAVVLLIACVNVANLLLSRAAVRRREVAARRALGAGFGQLASQGITEGLVLAAGGAALGLFFGFVINRILGSLLPTAHPDLSQYTVHLDVNWRVAIFTVLTSTLCALLFSLAPSLENARCDVTPLLKGGSGGRSRSGSRQRDCLVIVQVALSLVLLVSATLIIRALQEAASTDPGFATDKRAYLRLFTPDNDFTPQQATSLYSRLLEDARNLPGVQDVTLSFAVFGFMDGDCASISKSESPRKLNINVVEPNYFQFMRTPLLRGRTFNSGDRAGAPRVIVVNETMAQGWWPGENPIGKTTWLGCQQESRVPAEVIGVVRDSKYGSLDERPFPFYFVHWRQVWWNGFFALMVQAAGDLNAIEEPLLKLAQTGGANLRIYELRTFNDLISLSLFQVKWQATLLMAFSGLAIFLAAVGLYGVVAYAAAQRTQEIGVRMALGAQTADVKWMVLGHSLHLTVIGLVVGVLLSAGVTRLLGRFLFGVSPLDPLAFAFAGLTWILVSMVAGYIPARRATQIDPLVALRYE
jgi:macrolide transport system ATP-binding/permease protein